jgi:hypothetical protein
VILEVIVLKVLSINIFKHVINNVDMISDVKILPREPSQELLKLIDEVGKLGKKLSDLLERIKQKGNEEGFSNEEIKQLLKDKLKGILTRNQIKYYLYYKERLSLRRRLGEKTHFEDKKVIEKKSGELGPQLTNNQQSKAKIQDVRQQKPDMESLDGQDVNPPVLDLRATIEDQAQYINTLESKIQEYQETQRAQHQLRIRVSLSQLYLDVYKMRISGAPTHVDILIDGNNKYQTLEPI